MSFLAPAAAAIAAALSIPILIALYLLKLRRRPVRVSSVMFWTDADADLQVNVPLRWVRPSLLLLLHLLILGLLVLAVGRPTIEGMGAAGQERMVLLIDTSGSMRTVDAAQTTSRLERAKVRAAELVREARRSGGRREIAVIAFADQPATLAGFTSVSATITEAINAAAATDQPGRLDRALQLADALIAESGDGEEEGGTPASVVLLSDGSFTAQPLAGAAAAAAARTRVERIGPPLVDGATTPTDNVGITALSARRDYSDPAAVRVFAEFTNAGGSEVTAPVAVSVDGVVVMRRAVRIDPAIPARPGVASETFELRNPAGGVVLVSIERPDALAADNSAATVLSAAPRPAILLVRPVGDSGPGPSFLIEEVLAELPTRQVRIVDADTYNRFAQGGTGGGLEIFDLVIFDRYTPATFPRTPSLHFGGWPGAEGVTPSAAAGGPGEGRQRVVLWSRTHPALRDVSLDTVIVDGASGLRVSGDRGEIIARGEGGPLIAAVEDSGGRRLLVAFEPARSNWPVQVGFTIFLANAVEYLTLRGDAEVGRSFSTTEPARLPRPAGRDMTLDGPAPARVAAGSESVGVLPRAGIYVGRDAAGPVVVAVNMVDAHETLAAAPAALEVGGTPVAGAMAMAAPREIWHWFIAAAGVLLLIEWLVYAWRMRGPRGGSAAAA